MTRTENATTLGLSASSRRPPPGSHAALARNLAAPPHPLGLRMFVGRSLFPIITLVLIGGTLLWGPWVTLALAFVTWTIVGRLG